MRHIALSIALSLAALPSALAQTSQPALARAEVEQLKGVSKVFVSLFPPDAAARDRIIKAIREKVPRLSFVSAQEDADVWLRLSVTRVMETNRTPPNPSGQETGAPQFTYESTWAADGSIILLSQGVRPGIVAQFRRRGDKIKSLSEAFAKEFVRLYRKANPSDEASKGDGARALDGPARVSVGELTRQAPQDGGPEAEAEDVDEEVVRVNSTLVTVPASVVGRDGKYVTNLRREDFRVYENGVEQEVAFFANVDAPFTVAILIDTSDSTRPVLRDIVAAANAFVEQLRPDDRLIVICFDFEVREILKASKVGDVRSRGLQIPVGGGTTRLYDAVDFAVNERLRHLPGRKAVVLFTDGVDGGSNKKHDDSIRDAEESDILIYPVLYDTFEESVRQLKAMRASRNLPPPTDYLRKIYERGEKYLSRLAQLTGGRSQRVEGVGGISEAFASVVVELGRQYSLGYYPRTPARPGERRQIKVRVGLPDHAVRARDSYTVTSRGAGRPGRND